MIKIAIGLGANQGNRAAQLADARARLQHEGWIRLDRCSPLIESEPWGPVAQPWYLNQVCTGWTELPPRPLMRWLLTVERLGGRERTREQRWGPRPIDIDLLAWGDRRYRDHLVEVPHPRLHQRRFVLGPWCTVDPEWRHPVSGLTVVQMYNRVDDHGLVRFYQERCE